MKFSISHTFQSSLTNLTNHEQKVVNSKVSALYKNPENPAFHFERLENSRDRCFWSARVNRDLRFIIHRMRGSMMLCYVDHHDQAYDWVKNRRLDLNAESGAAELVVVREVEQEVVVPRYVPEPAATAAQPTAAATAAATAQATAVTAAATSTSWLPLAERNDAELLSTGLPRQFLDEVRQANEDRVLAIAGQMPSAVGDALIELVPANNHNVSPVRLVPETVAGEAALADRKAAATAAPAPLGAGPNNTAPTALTDGPDSSAEETAAEAALAAGLEHPEAQQRFRVIENAAELARALAAPWEKWAIFLHPAQHEWVERRFNGPARVSGSAGTGKTVVALHRAVYLARQHPEARVWLTTVSRILAAMLEAKLPHLVGGEPQLARRLEVGSLGTVAKRLYTAAFAPPRLAWGMKVQSLLLRAQAQATEATNAAQIHHAAGRGARQRVEFMLSDPKFLLEEWENVVDARQLDSWEAYRQVSRLGRKTPLPESHRAALWPIFAAVRAGLQKRGLVTWSDVYSQLATHFAPPPAKSTAEPSADPQPTSRPRPFDFIVVDESQDVSVAQLRFLAALGAERPNGLFFAGDLRQQIFQQPFSWRSLGVEITGRARTLRVNYRTSHQIRVQADKLLDDEISDVDGNTESRRGTVSVFNGPQPCIQVLESQEAERVAVADWLQARRAAGVAPEEIGLFVRSSRQFNRARAAVEQAGLSSVPLNPWRTTPGQVLIGTMHQAKGLEFRAVAVMACDEEVIPSPSRLKALGDHAEQESVYTTERHLLYVACTRARDDLLVTGVTPGSEFLDDLENSP